MVYWNTEYFQVLYEKYLSSGISVRDFCKEQGIREARFYFWSKKLKDHTLQSIKSDNQFIPIKPKVLELTSSSSIMPHEEPEPVRIEKSDASLKASIQISYPNGVTVSLEKGTSHETVQLLISLI